MFRKMPLILMAIILAVICFDRFIPYELKSFLFAMSLSIKTLIITLLPFIIFGLLFKVAAQLAHNATKIILLILVGVCCSNFISTMLSHFVGVWIYHFDLSIMLPHANQTLTPLWTFTLPKLIANDKAMFAGLILGIITSHFFPQPAEKIAQFFSQIITRLLQGITYAIPFFVTGFVIKLDYEGAMATIIHDYAIIFTIIAIAQFSYIGFIYLVANNGKLRACLHCLKNMLPAAIAGFSTMSSAAAMPLTLIGTEKNTQQSDIARSVIPATVNIHLIGDCFAIPILAFAVLKSYGLMEPTFFAYLTFAFYFVLAKFSVAAVPGGGILVMLPILETYLGFNAEMMSLITALYILFDPVITGANVLGNGGFALVINKIQGMLTKTKIIAPVR